MPPKDSKPKKKKAKPTQADKGVEYIRAGEAENLETLLGSLTEARLINKHEIKFGKNMLHAAVEEENLFMVSMVIDYGAKVNFRTKETQQTACHIASYFNYLDILDLLLTKNIDITITDTSGNTAFHVAASRGFKEILTSLVEDLLKITGDGSDEEEETFGSLIKGGEGASLDGGDSTTESATETDTITETGPDGGGSLTQISTDVPTQAIQVSGEGEAKEGEEKVETMDGETKTDGERKDEDGENDEDDEDEEEGGGEASIISTGRKVIRKDITFEQILEAKNNVSETALMKSVTMQHFQVADYLVDCGADINEVTLNGNTCITRTAFDGRIETAKWLLNYCKSEVNLHHRTFNGETATLIAVKQANFELAELFIKEGGNINDRDNMGNTALHFGCMSARMDVVEFCLEKCINCHINGENDWGMTPAMVCARNQKSGKILDYLIQKECDLNILDKNYMTALMHACRAGCMANAHMCIKYGCDYNAKDAHGQVARDYLLDNETLLTRFDTSIAAFSNRIKTPPAGSLRVRPVWIDRQIQEEKDEAYRLYLEALYARMEEEEKEMAKQEAVQQEIEDKLEAERLAEEEKKRVEWEALDDEERDKILRKEAKEKSKKEGGSDVPEKKAKKKGSKKK